MAVSYKDPTATVNQVLGRVPVQDRGKLGVDLGSYIRQLSDLWRVLQGGLGGLRTQEALVNTGYENDLAESAVSRARALRGLSNAFGDRGLAQSGINLREQGEVGQQFNRADAALGLERRRGLADISRQRQGLEGNYIMDRGGIESGLANRATQFLQEQANTNLMNFFAALAAQQQPRPAIGGGFGGGGGRRSTSPRPSRPTVNPPQSGIMNYRPQTAIPNASMAGMTVRPRTNNTRASRSIVNRGGAGYSGGNRYF